MKTTELRQLIRESINDYIREIEIAGDMAAHTAKEEATQKAIDERKRMLDMEGIDEVYHKMLDKTKMKELGSEIKALEKSLAKLKKQKEKLESKANKGEKVEDVEEKEIVDEVVVDENFPESGPELEEELEEEMNIYEVLNMQKLAGIISEEELIAKIEEAKKKPSTGLTKKEKSAVVTKARAGKDIGKKGKGFEAVAKAAGGGEKGKKIAAAAMWKAQAKK